MNHRRRSKIGVKIEPTDLLRVKMNESDIHLGHSVKSVVFQLFMAYIYKHPKTLPFETLYLLHSC